jgi:hypothetical protein
MRIIAYQIAWHPQQNVGDIRLQLENGTWRRLQAVSAEAFAAITRILDDEPVMLSPNGWIHTGPEAPGE